MLKAFHYIINTFFGNALELRVRLFNILAAAGFLVSVLMGVMSAIMGNDFVHVLANVGAATLSLSLLLYSYKTGKYQRCYIISIFVIFLGFFSVLFFTAGGLNSGMPSFFMFAIIFTVFMLRGKTALLMVGFELLYYTGICLLAFLRPETVTPYDSQAAAFISVWGSCMLISVILGALMLLHFSAYDKQREQLELSRQEAVKLSEIKSTFLANMSHEIRTPINVLLGMNEMVLRENDSDVVTGYAKSIESAGKTLLSLVNNILDVSKIESGKVDLTEEKYSLANLIHELALIGQERTGRRSLRFDTKVDNALPSQLYGDYMHIKQIVLNFLSNAAKYTEEGGVTLHIRTAGIDGETLKLRIRVTDTGIGIKQENLATLFDAFTRVDMPAHKDIQGTGLGLAIARELADVIGGSISVESIWGVGSSFTLDVEQRIVDSSPMGDWKHINYTQSTHGSNGFIAPAARILVVDDNAANLQVIKSLLARTMMHVDTAQGGAECLKLAGQQQYHAILMDYRMPDMDGIQTFRALQQLPGFATPVIALTANAVAGSERMFLDEGFAAYLTKPVMWDLLERALMKALPDELVLRSDKATGSKPLEAKKKQRLETMLLDYDIDMEKGLRYLNGDITQYQKMAEIFIGDYPSAMGQIETLFEARDWQRLLYPIHSLKSKARMAGATALSNIATSMEHRCQSEDSEFLQAAFPLLLIEWQRAIYGLEQFAEAMDGAAAQKPMDEKVDYDELLGHIRAYRRKEAGNMLRQLLAAQPGEPKQKAGALREILEAVESLDFEKAEMKLRTREAL